MLNGELYRSVGEEIGRPARSRRASTSSRQRIPWIPSHVGWVAAEPISIGDNVWLGSGVVVCPGVTVGTTQSSARAESSRAICPRGWVVALGVPATVRRVIAESDRIAFPLAVDP